MITFPMCRHTAFILSGLALLASAAGCGPAVGRVSGKVACDGKALSSGTVTFVTSGGEARSTVIGPDGRYALEDVPIGPARIAVVSHPRVPPALLKPSGPTRQAVKSVPPRALRIPERYRDAEKSGLTCTVQGGSQTHDIVLRP